MVRSLMLTTLAGHLSRNLVAYLALFVALAGASYAAITVGSAQIRDNTVRSVDIGNRSIKGVDIARGTLRADNFRAGTLPGGIQRTAGPTGAPGPADPVARAPGTAARSGTRRTWPAAHRRGSRRCH